tara:strand:+ start:1404 stop:1637 length:234 start_codon:yes stop_codon:yes gene_type:complete
MSIKIETTGGFLKITNEDESVDRFIKEITTSIVNDDDETLMFGWTPSFIKAEIKKDANGFTRKRIIDGTGAETWVLT